MNADKNVSVENGKVAMCMLRDTITVVCCVIGFVIGFAAFGAKSHARALSRLSPAGAPCSVLRGHPCHPSFCGVFHRGPCFPYYLPPLGEGLRLTIVSTDENDPTTKGGGDANKNGGNADTAADDHTLDTIRDMFEALRACWIAPPRDEARHGMEYTIRFAFKRDGELIAPPRMTYSSQDAPADARYVYRDAVNAALARCTPLHFSNGMGDAVAGRPIAIRFVDDRTADNGQ